MLLLAGVYFLIPLYAGAKVLVRERRRALLALRRQSHSLPDRVRRGILPLAPPGGRDDGAHAWCSWFRRRSTSTSSCRGCDGSSTSSRSCRSSSRRSCSSSACSTPRRCGCESSPYLLSLVYVILALPFVYRSLDAGLSAVDLKTLVEASRSLGGRWGSTLLHVILPNLDRRCFSHGADDRPGPGGVHHGEPGPLDDAPGVDLPVPADWTPTSPPQCRCCRFSVRGCCSP